MAATAPAAKGIAAWAADKEAWRVEIYACRATIDWSVAANCCWFACKVCS